MTPWETFLEFEEKYKLFDLKEEGLYIWDIIRFQVYLDYMWENFQDQQAKEKIGVKILQSLKRIGCLIPFLFKPSRPNLFFTFSRDKTAEGLFYDKTANDFLQRLHQSSHIIESYPVSRKKYLYPVALIIPPGIFNRISYFLYRGKDRRVLLEKINSVLHLSWTNRRINKLVSYFRSEKRFYSLLLGFKKPQRIYFTYGLPKALLAAAKEKEVETIEFQHGIIDKGHIAYNYPPDINVESNIYLPDLLLTFSEFWGHDIHYPVKKMIPVGNATLARIDHRDKKFNPLNKTLAFISADVFGEQLAVLAKEYADSNPNDVILFKLHTNEFTRRKEYEKSFGDHPNIRVIANEAPLETIISGCDAIVLIQSTIAYHALQSGIPLFIYKKMTYYRHSRIFSNPNVKLIDNARQIVIAGNAGVTKSKIFFDDFHENVYQLLSNFQ